MTWPIADQYVPAGAKLQRETLARPGRHVFNFSYFLEPAFRYLLFLYRQATVGQVCLQHHQLMFRVAVR